MKAYAIKDPKGNIITESVFSKKSFSIDYMRHDYRYHFSDWKQFYNEGYRCVPVEITEIKQKKK